jgi:glycosyltransferase involved in cell wall biosynthesis
MVAPGGSVHSIRPLTWLLQRNHEVLFVDDTRPAVPDGLAFAYAPYPLGASRRLWLGWRLSYRVGLAALRRLARRFRPDVVHVHWIDHRAVACADAGLRPLVFSAWGSDINRLLLPDADASKRRQVGAALAKADLVFADSPDMPEKCATLAGTSVSVSMLPLAIDTTLFRPAPKDVVETWRRRLDVPDDAALLLSARAWGAVYQQELILEAFAKARKAARRRAILVFKVYNAGNYGEAAELTERIRARIDELGIAADIRWLSDVPVVDLPGVYSAVDAVINFPAIDGFPVTFMEAAACECPVISADLSAYRGALADKFFRLVPAGDADALAAAICEQIDADPRAARAALHEARALVVREYDQSVSANRLLEHYAELLRQNTRR